MRLISTICFILLATLIDFSSTTYGASTPWPLKGQIDLASGFGDFRQDRFHAGLDLRTGGVIGAHVFAPVDGYVSRVRLSYYGYGKGLYFTGHDGHLYVFGHLSAFYPVLDTLVKKIQIDRKRYYVDLEFPKDSIMVRAGSLIGISGQTGAGAPHLHFEERALDNRPIDPLTHSYTLPDKTKPVFSRIGFQFADDHSLFDKGLREEYWPVREGKKSGEYVLDTALYFNSPFGLLADAYDQIRPDGMKQAIYDLSVYVDDTLYYRAVLDTLEFESGGAADLTYDFDEAVSGEARVRRLYALPGDEFPGIRALSASKGLIGTGPSMKFGKHTGEIRAVDASGNKSRLTFSFVWGPPGPIYTLDSTSKVDDSNMNFYFTAAAGWQNLRIDTIQVWLNHGTQWGVTPSAQIHRSDDGHLRVHIFGHLIELVPLRLGIATRDKCLIRDPLFNGYVYYSSQHTEITYDLTDDGLIFRADFDTRKACRSALKLFCRDSLLGTLPLARFVNMQSAAWYVPPIPQFARIDRVGVVTWVDTFPKMVRLDSLNIALVGASDSVILRADTLFDLTFTKADLYSPRFVALKKDVIVNKMGLHLSSDRYLLQPQSFVMRQPFKLSMTPLPLPDSIRSALYHLDEKKDRWIWTTDSTKAGLLYGSSRLGGSYAAVYDLDRPIITDLSVREGQIITDVRPVITFGIKEDCSGLADDRSIVIKLDDKWQIPEYDPELNLCQTQPMAPLGPGSHHLSIEVTDRAGNMGYEYLHFTVRTGGAQPKGK